MFNPPEYERSRPTRFFRGMSGLQNRTLNRLADLTRALVTIRAFLRQAALDHCCQLVWSRAASWTSFSKASLSSGLSPFWASSIMFAHSMSGVRAILAISNLQPKASLLRPSCHKGYICLARRSLPISSKCFRGHELPRRGQDIRLAATASARICVSLGLPPSSFENAMLMQWDLPARQ